jgi:peptide/nickel transport system substrate-binding protein
MRRIALGAVAVLALLAAGAQAQPKPVVVVQSGEAATLDWHMHCDKNAHEPDRQLFDTLLRRDVKTLKLEGNLAESWRLVNDTTWQFKLRRGLKFHNGEPLDAEAVKFSLERLVDPKLKLRGATPFAPISHVEVVDPLTVRVHTKAPWPILDTLMSGSGSSILPPKYYREKELTFVARNPVGSGPFKFVRWVKDDRIELEANEQYWRGAPRIKRLTFKPIPDDAVRVAALQNGEVDVAVNIPPHLAGIIANHPRLFLSTAPSVRTIQLMYYTHQFDAQHKLVGPYAGPVADRRVRLAMNYAVDGDEVIRTVLDGKGIRVATMLTDKHFGFDPVLKPIKPDLARSKQLLTEAGFPGGLDIVFNAPQGRYVRDKEVAEAITGQLNKAGIRTTLRVHEWGNYLNNMAYVHKAGPVWLIGWGTPTYDAETVYVPLFRSGKILSNYHNADFDGMVDQAQTIMEPKRRFELYQRINKLWIDDAAAMPLYQQLDLYGATRRMSWKARGDEGIKGFDMAVKDAR